MYRGLIQNLAHALGQPLGLKPFVDHRHARVGLAAVIQGIMGVAGCAQHAGAGGGED